MVLARQPSGADQSVSWAWQLVAACRGLPAAVFYPPDNERGQRRRRRELRAKQVCAACPVITDCLRHAVRWPETEGIWGGTTPGERGLVPERISHYSLKGHRQNEDAVRRSRASGPY